MRCPECDARNTPDAPWCTQCLTSLDSTGREAGDATAATTATAAAAPSSTAAGSPASPGAGQGADRRFRSVDGTVQWRCPRCDTWSPLEVTACTACGQPLAASVTGADAAGRAVQVSRARRWLWVAAAVGGAVPLVALVLLALALRGGA